MRNKLSHVIALYNRYIVIDRVRTKPLTDPVSMYRRIRDATFQPDIKLHEWLETANQEDWESLTWLVNNHFTPVDLYHQLCLVNAVDFVPIEEREFLKACVQLESEREEHYLADVGRLVTALNSDGITPTLLKGAALISGGYYPQGSRRFMVDIDFAVRPHELDRAILALEQHGFVMKLTLPRPVQAYWRTKHDLPSMWHEASSFGLECHSRPMDKALLYSAPYDLTSLLGNARGIEIVGGWVKIPCPEHLVVHAFFHSQLYDMYELAGVDNYRAMIDVSTIVAKEGERFNWLFVNELINSIHAKRSFALFVDRIAHCVDSRACAWPIDRCGVKYKKQIHTFFSSHRKVGLLLASVAIYTRAVSQALSREGRAERRILFKANPHEMRFSPVWRQLLIPSIWTKRVRLIANRAGIGSN